MNSSAERFPDLFHEALRLDGVERIQFIDRECGEDVKLRARLVKMIAAAESGVGDEDEDLAGAVLLDPNTVFDPDSLPGYELQQRIGTGGMGVVFRAQQHSPRRATAIKILRNPLCSPEAKYRFTYEAEVLGRLRHPGIASIYEAGTFATASGRQPFFAMEFIDGHDLLAYAKQRELDLRSRLLLIADVCDAIQSAHESGVVHRDLKPANLLVDKDGNVKVLDFGVARALDADREGEFSPTLTGQLVGTLAYMSPEQASGAPVDGRTDVYALGVVAYELLSGSRPYQVDEMNLQDSLRMIVSHEPTLLGMKDRRFRGDVETIIGKALEKDPERRYASIRQFGDEIARYLNDEPITARPPSTVYRVTKFVRRNRAMVGSVVVAFVFLVGGLIGTGYGLIQMDAANSEAVQSAEESERALELLERLFQSVQGEGVEARVIDALHSATSQLDERSDLPPAVSSRMRHVLGKAYHAIGDHKRAATLLEQAISDLSDHSEGELWVVRADLAVTMGDLGQLEQAREQLRELLLLVPEQYGPEHQNTLEVECDLAMIEHRLEPGTASVDRWRRVRGAVEKSLDPGDPLSRRAQQELANALSGIGEHREAIALARRSLDIAVSEFGEGDLRTADSRRHLAWVLDKFGAYTEGDALLRSVLAVQVAKLPLDHPEVLETKCRLAIVCEAQWEWEKAELLIEEVLSAQAKYGPLHVRTIEAKTTLGRIYRRTDRKEEALELFEKLTDEIKGKLGINTPQAIELAMARAVSFRNAGKLEFARDEMLALVERIEPKLGIHSPMVLAAKLILGSIYERLEDPVTAVEYYKTVYKAPECWVTLGAARYLAKSARNQWNFEKSEEFYLKALSGALERYREGHPYVSSARAGLSVLYEIIGEHDKAIEHIKADVEAYVAFYGSDHPKTLGARYGLVPIYVRMGRSEEAEKVILKMIPMLDSPDLSRKDRKHGLAALAQLAVIHNTRGHFETALLHSRRAYQEAVEMNLDDTWIVYFSVVYAEALIGVKEYDKAEPLLLKSRQHSTKYPNIFMPTLECLATLFEATSRSAEANELRKELAEFKKEYEARVKKVTDGMNTSKEQSKKDSVPATQQR